MVHRLLAASLGPTPLPSSSRDKDSVHSTSLNLNVRHHNAQLAGRASVELHTLIFFKDRTVVADARVVKVRVQGVLVLSHGDVYRSRPTGWWSLCPSMASRGRCTFTSEAVRRRPSTCWTRRRRRCTRRGGGCCLPFLTRLWCGSACVRGLGTGGSLCWSCRRTSSRPRRWRCDVVVFNCCKKRTPTRCAYVYRIHAHSTRRRLSRLIVHQPRAPIQQRAAAHEWENPHRGC